MTSEVIFSLISGKRTVYLDSYGRIFCVKTVSGVDTVEWLYYFTVNEDGSINIPEALRPYMGGKEKIG